MRPYALAFTVSAAVLSFVALPRPAHALGPIDLEASAKIGGGTHSLGFGAGGRAGVSLFGLYGGLNVVDYLGSSPGAGLPSAHLLTYGGEVGFGIKISRVTIRPLFGFGDATTSTAGLSSSSFYLEPGGLIQVRVFSVLTVGVDAGCLILTSASSPGTTTTGTSGSSTTGPASSTFEAFTMHGQVGVQF